MDAYMTQTVLIETALVGPPKPGTLVLASAYRWLGHVGQFDYYACISCRTEYPAGAYESESVLLTIDDPPLFVRASVEPLRNIRCNGHIIDQCPWCRPDSHPWTAGRGK